MTLKSGIQGIAIPKCQATIIQRETDPTKAPTRKHNPTRIYNIREGPAINNNRGVQIMDSELSNIFRMYKDPDFVIELELLVLFFCFQLPSTKKLVILN
jgi:hypothetical protein